jgi:hypothetical protein
MSAQNAINPENTPDPSAAGAQQPNANSGQPAHETVEARTYAKAFAFVQRLRKESAKFTRDESGEVLLHYKGRIISLEPGSKDLPNYDLDELLSLDGCPGTETLDCRVERKWIQLIGRQLSKETTAAHLFSAASKDYEHLYIPIADGILLVTKNSVEKITNGEKPDGIILESAKGQEPFSFVDEPPAEGLRLFEQLVVKKQTAVVPEMAWLAAMQEMLFVFLRHEYKGERAIVIHVGLSNSGKTGSILLFVWLHGFEEPTTKITPAAILNTRAQSGISFFDNQEEHNLTDALQDALITMASGGGKKTAVSQFGGPRPVVVITTIDSFSKPELLNRSIPIEHWLDPEAIVGFSALEHQKKLLAERNRIMSALMHVLAEFKRQPVQKEAVPTGAGKFSDNYRALCGLLRAYERTAQKPACWADKIIAVWHSKLSNDAGVAVNENLSFVVQSYIEDTVMGNPGRGIRIENGKLNDGTHVSGTLHVAGTTALFSWAQGRYAKLIPTSSSVFGRRLSEVQTPGLRVLREDDVPKDSELYPHLKHTSQKFVGFLQIKSDRL